MEDDTKDDTKKQDNIIEKIDKQIQDIETRINKLLEDIEIEGLTVTERLDFSIKLQGQLARFLALRKSRELNIPEGRENTLMAVWMRQLRGENRDG